MSEMLPARWANPARILVATDLNDLDRLMPVAFRQAAASGAQLILLHAIPNAAAVSLDAGGMPVFDPAEAIQNAEQTLSPWCQVAAARSLVCDALVRQGQPAQQILSAAGQLEADRILIGVRSQSEGRKLYLGSVAEQVLRSVHLPVVTVGPEAHLLELHDEQIPVVLCATTLGETSRPSAALAFHLAEREHGRMILLHVVSPGARAKKSPPAEALERLRQLAECTAERSATPIEPRLVHGNRLIEILAAADQFRAEWIVLGSNGRRCWEHRTRERAVLQVLAHARCPVLTLHPSDSVAPESEDAAAESHTGYR